MSERTASAARDAHLRRLQQALACISPAVLRRSQSDLANTEFIAGTEDGGVPVRTAARHLTIRVRHHLRVAHSDGWQTETTGYAYQLYTAEAAEMLAFHWHPALPGVASPHLHLSPGAGSLRPEFHRAHIPTGQIAFERFVEFVIRDFGVVPLRRDYAQVLAATSRP